MKDNTKFLTAGLFLLGIGLLFGVTGALQYIVPGFLKSVVSFEKIRPLHVSSVVFWIILTAVGCAIHYVGELQKPRNPKLVKIAFWLFISAVVLILISYIFGIFGGREYWEFHPILALPIICGWILLLIHFFKTIKTMKQRPVYVWMWLTGFVFFLFTFLESYLWLIPNFRSDIITDMTIQWKSYGSMVGSWNMLIYGSSIYLMDKISGHQNYSFSKTAFLIYFLGLFNLMFNWGHHIYSLPTPIYIRYISYGVSMTELILLGRIIFLWKSSLNTAKKHLHLLPYKFLIAADFWIFTMLILAIIMSIPGINLYTHGTHITVAHTMGATIGINTMLLLAFVYDILGRKSLLVNKQKLFNRAYLTINLSLFVFCSALIVAGIIRSQWQMDSDQTAFGTMMKQLMPFFIIFCIAGIAMTVGFFLLFRHLYLEILLKNKYKYPAYDQNHKLNAASDPTFTSLKKQQ